MRTKLLILSIIALAGNAWAGTLTFQGTITNVRIVGDEFVALGLVETKVGDSFFGTVEFNKDLIPISAIVEVEGAYRPWQVPETWGSYFVSFSLNPFSFEFVAGNTDGYSGTDASAQLSADGILDVFTIDAGTQPLFSEYVEAYGIVTRETLSTPDTGSTIALAGLALLGLLTMRRWRWRMQ